MKNTPEGKKRLRKRLRAARHAAGIDGYRSGVREEIQRMREHNAHAATADDRITPDAFRLALKRLRHNFMRAIAGRQVRA